MTQRMEIARTEEGRWKMLVGVGVGGTQREEINIFSSVLLGPNNMVLKYTYV